MAYLSNIEFHTWEDISGLLTRPVDRKNPVLGALALMYQNRPYFIFNWGYTEKGRPYTHMLWRHEDPGPNADPNMVELIIPHPITEDVY